MREIALDSGARLELATVGRRIGAEVVDGVLVTAAGFTVATVTAGSGVGDIIFFLFVLGVLAYRIGTVALWGQNIGKAAVGIEVVRLDGRRPGWGRSTIRWAVATLPLGIPVVGFIYLVAWFIALAAHEHRRGWHDLVAGTAVVRKMESQQPYLGPA